MALLRASGRLITPLLCLERCRLRLAIYKGLGFEPVVDKDGRIGKMLVRM